MQRLAAGPYGRMPTERPVCDRGQVRSERTARTQLLRSMALLNLVFFSTATLSVLATSALAQDADAITAQSTLPAATQSPEGQPISDDCFEALENGTGPWLSCRVPLRLSPLEQSELEKASRGYVKDVSCMLTIQIERAALDAPLASPDYVFESPEQPVACTVTTYKATFDITATFAPRVVFKAHAAVEATPGLANVKGVSRVISWPLVQFVNRWPSIRKGMLQVVNAYLERQRDGTLRAPQSAP